MLICTTVTRSNANELCRLQLEMLNQFSAIVHTHLKPADRLYNFAADTDATLCTTARNLGIGTCQSWPPVNTTLPTVPAVGMVAAARISPL